MALAVMVPAPGGAVCRARAASPRGLPSERAVAIRCAGRLRSLNVRAEDVQGRGESRQMRQQLLPADLLVRRHTGNGGIISGLEQLQEVPGLVLGQDARERGEAEGEV